MKGIKILLLTATLALATNSASAEQNIVALKGSVLLYPATCDIGKDLEHFTVYCEIYLGADGYMYAALYYKGEIYIVKRQKSDGTWENVYIDCRNDCV